MKRTKETRKWKISAGGMVQRGLLTLAMVLFLVLFQEPFAMVSHAESAAKVTTTANIRRSPDKNSEAIASAEKDKVISIRSQVKGSDGYTWYQIFVDSNTLGYIRGDMVQITDGTTPPEESSLPAVGGGTAATPTPTPNGGGTAATPTPPPAQTQAPKVTSADVTVLNPVSATVKSNQSVRVRNMPSTNGQIVGSAANGLVVTVNGQAPADSSGKAWYQVNFTDNGKEITGFIREDFLELSEPPTPYVEPTQEPDPTPEPTQEPTPTPDPQKPYDVVMEQGQWWLMDMNSVNENGQHDAWGIDGVLELIKREQEGGANAGAGSTTQKIIIILLVIFLVAAGGVIAFLVFKIKDMADSAYFNEVENETLNRRRTAAGGQGTRRVMQSVGAERTEGSRTGQRSTQGGSGTRPSGASRGTRPAGGSQGTRPGGTPQGSRPQGNGQGMRPGGVPQGTRPRPRTDDQGWQSRNFMAEDEDEFEFDFLNQDGEV